MAIQLRRGAYADFDPQKMKPAEVAVVQEDDPTSYDGKAVYVAISPGDVKRMAVLDELQDEVYNQIDTAISTATQAAVATATQAAAESASEAAASASAAAESARTLTIDATLTQSGQAADSKATGVAIAELKNDLIVNKGEVFGGDIAPNFELGTIYFDDQWKRVNSKRRIRFHEGETIRLQRGCKISLSDYSFARLNIGWKIDGAIAGYSGWLTSGEFETSVEAEYSIAVMSYPETDQTDVTALASLLVIDNVDILSKLESTRLFEVGNFANVVNTDQGYINPAGWHVTPTENQERVTNFISVNEGDTYVVCSICPANSDALIQISCYSNAKDGNSAFIQRIELNNVIHNDNISYIMQEFNIPSGCKYIRVAYRTFGESNYYLFDISNGKMSLGLASLYGYFQSLNNSVEIENLANAEKFEIIRSDKEINLNNYTPINYNLESGRWASSSVYRAVLIPAKDLTFSLDLIADTYKISYAFLKSDIIEIGAIPDLCRNEKVYLLSVGTTKHVKVPDDCAYLYVYITNGSAIGQIHIIDKAIITDFKNVRDNAKGIVYISDVDQILRTIKHRHDGNQNTFTGTNVSDNLLVLAHISDVHNDPSAYTRYITFLNANTDICNAGIVSGDLVDAGVAWMYEEMVGCEENLSEGATLIKCVGNHERQGMTSAEVYSALHLDTNTGKNYYYIDYAEQKIRVICLDQYDVDSSDSSIAQATAHYTQTQINWLISTLKDAAQNEYAVIIVYHSCNEIGFPEYNESGFCQDRTYSMHSSPTSGTIIADIVNAWQNGIAIDATYEVSDISDTLIVNDTFAEAGTFICYICGHEHIDYIGYFKKYPKQLVCIVQGAVVESTTRAESVAHWQSMYDTPRVPGTSTVDSINVYAIDTVSKLLKVVKIGSTLTDKFVPRSFATFKYY